MDATRFDDLTKALATSNSRRAALKAIGAALGGALGLSSIGTAFAMCQPARHACGTPKQCCSNVCCNGTCCASGQSCDERICVGWVSQRNELRVGSSRLGRWKGERAHGR